MYLAYGWLGVVRRQAFEFYLHHGDHCALWHTVNLSHGVGSATFTVVVPPQGRSSVRVCITCREGIFLYTARCRPDQGIADLILDHQYPSARVFSTRGLLGASGRLASWFRTSARDDLPPVNFVIARMRGSNETMDPDLFELCGGDMPSLHALPVYDFDDARGVVVLGNALGELSLLDFSRSNPRLFAECHRCPIKLPQHAFQDPLPMVSD